MRPAPFLLVAALTSCNDAGLTGKKAPYEITQIEAVIMGGQSNSHGHNFDPNGSNDPPFGVPTSLAALFRRIPTGGPAISDTVLQYLKVTTGTGDGTYHGAELAMGLALRDALGTSTRVAILKVSAGSTFVTDWIEGGVQNAWLQDAIADFIVQLGISYPGVPIRWHWVWNQGEAEAGSATETAALAYATNFETLHGQMETYVSQVLRPHITPLWPGSTLQWAATVNAQKQIAATATDGYYLTGINSVITAATIQSDDIHWTGEGQDLAGSDVEAPSILADIAAH